MSESDRPARSFAARFFGALLLDGSVYHEVEHDPRALTQAAGVVALGGLARGVAEVTQDGWLGLAVGFVGGMLIWPAAAALVWAIGVRSFGYTSDFRELLRTLGFAAAPLVLLALCVIPIQPLRLGLFVVAHALAVLAFGVAVRQALDVSPSRALFVCLLAAALSLVLLFLLGILLLGSSTAS